MPLLLFTLSLIVITRSEEKRKKKEKKIEVFETQRNKL